MKGYIEKHIQKIIKLPLVNKRAITKANFKIVVDCINSVGALSVPPLLVALGVKQIIELNNDMSGRFAHDPEPLAGNLSALSNEVKRQKADLGIVVDPDVDRLAFICEDGRFFGEEYTLVAVADYVLSNKKGNTVSNLSSSRALRDITKGHGGKYKASAVGEVNVVALMKKTKAIIGGEGNGGVIYPALHYGRDALVGVALFLSHLAKSGSSCTALRESYPNYHMHKSKFKIDEGFDVNRLIKGIKDKYKGYPFSDIDGIRIEFENEWVHLRISNTEPVVRVYGEGTSVTIAENIVNKILDDVKNIVKEAG